MSPKCPRGCRPATALDGYIDERAVSTAGFLHVWIRPDGEDFTCSDHTDFAMKELRRLRVTRGNTDAIGLLEQRGWVRLSGYLGALSVEMATVPTPAQTRTLHRYLTSPGVVFRGAAMNVAPYSYMRSEGRVTAGRIAAWAAQVLEPRAALGRVASSFVEQAARNGGLHDAKLWWGPNGEERVVEAHIAGAQSILRVRHVRTNPRVGADFQLIDLGWVRAWVVQEGLQLTVSRRLSRAQEQLLYRYVEVFRPAPENTFVEIAQGGGFPSTYEYSPGRRVTAAGIVAHLDRALSRLETA